MKPYISLIVLLFSLQVFSQKAVLPLPANAKKAIVMKHGTEIKVEKWKQTNKKKNYEIEAILKGQKIDIELDSMSKWQESVFHIEESNLPTSSRSNLSNYPNAELKKIRKVVKSDETYYKFKMLYKRKEYSVKLSDKGEVLKVKEEK